MTASSHMLRDYRRFVTEAWAVHVAINAGLFEALDKPQTLHSLCEANGWEPSALTALLRALAACGHLRQDINGAYELTEQSQKLLLRVSSAYIGDALSFLSTTPAYLRYPDILRGAKAVGLDDAQWSKVAQSSALYARTAVGAIVEHYPELAERTPLRLLDVGCGRGAYLIALQRVWPHATILGVDPTAQVVREAQAQIAMANLHRNLPRVEQALLEDVRGTFDLIMFNQILHLTGRHTGASMLERARKLLSAGGRVFVQEILDGGQDPAPALFGLNMRLLFDDGCALSFDELTTMLIDAGFKRVTVHLLDPHTPGLAYAVGHT